jgi:hypothetical protein
MGPLQGQPLIVTDRAHEAGGLAGWLAAGDCAVLTCLAGAGCHCVAACPHLLTVHSTLVGVCCFEAARAPQLRKSSL